LRKWLVARWQGVIWKVVLEGCRGLPKGSDDISSYSNPRDNQCKDEAKDGPERHRFPIREDVI